MTEYIDAAYLVEQTPPEVVFHRLTGTASPQILLAPHWCRYKWRVIVGIAAELARRDTRKGGALTTFTRTGAWGSCKWPVRPAT